MAIDSDKVIVEGFGNRPATLPTAGGAAANAIVQREMGEIQAMLMMARAQPRDPAVQVEKILNECMRPGLAEVAVYEYGRGGTAISGPSIRLAETIARNWRNIDTGVREIARHDGYSEVETFAWDLEAGFRERKTFQVRHWRDTKQGGYKLTDERDIYEVIANQAARRQRACILAVIPGDVVDAAVRQCEITLKAKADTSPEAMAKMVEAFGPWGIDKSHIEKRIQRKLDAITPAQVLSLKRIYASLRDGMAQPQDFFEMTDPIEGTATATTETAPTDRAAALAAAARAAAAKPAATPPAQTAQAGAGAAKPTPEASTPTPGRKSAPKPQKPAPLTADQQTAAAQAAEAMARDRDPPGVDPETGEVMGDPEDPPWANAEDGVPAPGGRAPTYAEVMSRVETAETQDALDIAADMARAIEIDMHRREVLLRVAERKQELREG